MGLSFSYCQEKDLDWNASEIPLTLILILSGEFVISVTVIWMFEAAPTLTQPHRKMSQGEENE